MSKYKLKFHSKGSQTEQSLVWFSFFGREKQKGKSQLNSSAQMHFPFSSTHTSLSTLSARQCRTIHSWKYSRTIKLTRELLGIFPNDSFHLAVQEKRGRVEAVHELIAPRAPHRYEESTKFLWNIFSAEKHTQFSLSLHSNRCDMLQFSQFSLFFFCTTERRESLDIVCSRNLSFAINFHRVNQTVSERLLFWSRKKSYPRAQRRSTHRWLKSHISFHYVRSSYPPKRVLTHTLHAAGETVSLIPTWLLSPPE